MLRSLFGFDWRKSKAHWLLLSKFINPASPDDFTSSDDWKSVLREDPKQSINRFFKEGLLAKAELDAQLDYRYKLDELKDMLKTRGLTVSGRKSDLIHRLIEADRKNMVQAAAGVTVFICSESGREIVEGYLADEKEKRNKAEEHVLRYLQQRRFKEACMAVASYEAEQVFSRGIGIGWKEYNSTRDVAILKIIFESAPKILASLSDDSHLNSLRVAAGMMHIWGTNQCKKWLPQDFKTDLIMDNEAAARMFVFYALKQIQLAEFKRDKIVKQVEVLSARDSCDSCKKLAGKKYKLSEVPELPHPHCTHPSGCRCTLIPLIK